MRRSCSSSSSARRVAGVLQAVLLLIVWTHGCIGVHFWLALKPFYPRIRNLLLSVAVLLPALALLGYFQGGRDTMRAVQDPAWRSQHTDAGAHRN